MSSTGSLHGTNRRLNGLLDRVAPRICRLCDLRSDTDCALCSLCRDELVRNLHPCQRCALPLPAPPQAGDGSPRLCPECQASAPLVSKVVAPFVFDPALSWLIARWKYRREQALAETFAELWHWAVEEPPEIDVLMPVPLHWRRQLWRGFNQSADLVSALHRRLNLPPTRGKPPPRLLRCRAGGVQARAGRRQRQRQLRDVFTIRGGVTGLRIALVDDVCTTGATANAAAAVLLGAGAGEVQLWCIARTGKS